MSPKPRPCPFPCAVPVHVRRAGTQTPWLFCELALGIAVPWDWALPGAQVWAQPAPRCLLQHPASCWKRSWMCLEELQPLQCRRALRWAVVGVSNVCDWFQILQKSWSNKEISPTPPPTFSKEMVWCITAHCHSLWIPDSSRLWGFSAWLGELFIIIYFIVCWVELSGVSGTSGQWVLMES